MARAIYQERRRVISDSSDSEIEVIEKTSSGRLESISPPPGPSVPRLTFAQTPLRSRNDTNFVPTPLTVKKLDFSNVRIKTPGKKLGGLRFVQSKSPIKETAILQDQVDVRVIEGGQEVDDDDLEEQDGIEELDLGRLTLNDEENPIEGIICIQDEGDEEDDVDGMLHTRSTPSSNTGKQRSSSPHFAITSVASSPTPLTSETQAASPILVLSDADAQVASGSDSDSDADSVVWNPTPRRTPGRRRLIVSDSEDECDGVHIRDSPTQTNTTRDCNLHFKSPIQPKPESRSKTSTSRTTKGKPAALRFIEDEAFNHVTDEEDYEDEDTMGSLRDFIVDDDVDDEDEADTSEGDGSEEDSGSEQGERSGQEEDSGSGSDSDGIEVLSSPGITKNPSKRIENHHDDDHDDDENGGVLYYSPAKKIHRNQLPDLDKLIIASSESESESDDQSDISITRKKKKPVKPKASKGKGNSEKSSFSTKAWTEERTRIASSIFKDLDERVFEGKLGFKGVGASVIWNKRLLTTAGVARSKRTTKNGESVKDHWIELSEKVLTGEKQIINTVAHEMCHLATWVISNEYRNPHGRMFKSWGRKVMKARKDIEVTTTHAYIIEYKYEWKCSTNFCGKIYKRHSKSIDTDKHACGSCKGKLIPLFESRQKVSSAFQLYLKANMKYAKTAMPGSSHGEVMRALSKRWNEGDQNVDHEIFWKSASAAVAT
ncbi:uncharacterized protein IL334_005649 [Kwoniella shivajii]|uniref:SprT-like domain-containing protein n=1 Tax=Kwoniella shivajii TaxID=564305 RepID=A0ABZ1D453_9TREE|nr:hypothetical protein IL334_005649 [Kwoniella shivajii]